MSGRTWGRAAAAVLSAAGLGLLSLPILASPASAVGEASATVPFTDCTFFNFPMAYTPTISVGASRTDAGATKVSLVADLTELPGKAPVATAGVMDAELSLTVDGVAVVLKGSHNVDVPASTAIPVPRVFGEVTSAKTELDITVTDVKFAVATSSFGTITGACSDPVTALGKATVQVGAAPTPPPPPTSPPTTKPTAKPSASPTKKAGGSKGTPAKGSPMIKCTLGDPFFSPFDYPAKVTVAGARASDGATKVSLAGSMSALPGVAPVAIDALPMRLKLETKIDGKPVTLSGEGPITSAANAPISVPALTGTVQTDATNLEVEVVAMSFEMDELSGLAITADCTVASGGDLSALKVGVGSLKDSGGGDDTDGNGDGAGGSNGGTTTSPTSSVLPKTGGADSIPVIGLWAGGLALLGAAVLLLVPGSPARVRTGKHG